LWLVNDLAATLLTARFYELHRRRELPPATALRQAQLWLRYAKWSELTAYVETATQEGRLNAKQAQMMKVSIAEAGADLEGGRFEGAGEPPNANRNSGSERPFANPVYWGGFILYGL
jgi:CHAT domain-containing protein